MLLKRGGERLKYIKERRREIALIRQKKKKRRKL
jgi:hypothetical protein